MASTGISGVLDDETTKWLTGLDEVMYDKLAAVGLVAPRSSTTLGAFLDTYIRGRSDVKGGTRTVYGHTKRNLVAFFGENKPMRDITEDDADQWRLFLLEQGLSENTVRRRSGLAKQFFKTALKRKLVTFNPFTDLKVAVKGNVEKFHFVTIQEASKVLAACPDAQWRAIFALSRYGGLRCPSEHLALTWADINWERSRMTIHSTKTEHCEGDGVRVCPIFPELLPYLRDAFEEAEEGAQFVITRYRETNVNLRTQLLRIIRKAGLKPWPKLFQNLRATRQTELCQKFPEHVVCDWIGNTPSVAREHYLRTTDEHFEQATRPDEVTSEATQNPTQQMSERSRKASQPVQQSAFCDVKRGPATFCRASVGRVGFEPT
ncbi:MAG: tyrosine-type recombinase/integrase, partial [Planctomycetota bacterium]